MVSSQKEPFAMQFFSGRTLSATLLPGAIAVISGVLLSISHGITPPSLMAGFLVSLIWCILRLLFVGNTLLEETVLVGLYIITLGCLIEGALQIYGTDEQFFLYYYCMGGVITAISLLLMLVRRARASGAREALSGHCNRI